MLDLDIRVSGVMALITSGLAPELVRRFMRKAHKQALGEWAERRGFPGLGSRFSGAHMARLGLSERSPKYVKRVLRTWGKYLPYTSPFKTKPGGVAHMRDLVRREGGTKISTKNKTADVTTRMVVSGARILNRLTGDQAKYRREFLRLRSTYGKADRDWIEQRANELFTQFFNAHIDKETEKSIRARGRLAKLLGSGEETSGG